MSRERATLLAAILGSGIVFLDGTVVNVALPAIREDLSAGLAAQQWVIEGFLLALSALLLIGGSLGDLLGRRRVFVAGVIGFGVASLACAVAPSPVWLVIARAAQGVAGALLVPSTLALIVATFPPDRRAAAIGSWTAWTGMATVAGPLVGGLLIDEASWRWVFAINVPVVAAVLWLTRWIGSHPPSGARRIDWIGSALASAGLGAVVWGLIERRWALVGAGAVLLALFWIWERRAPAPMVPAGLFGDRNFSAGNLSTLAVYAGLSGGTFLLVIQLQQVAGWSALAAGAATIPVTLLMLLFSKRVGALADSRGPRWFMTAGPIVAGAGFLMLLAAGREVDYVTDVLPGVVVFGVGLTLTVAPLTATVLSSASEEHAGVASGVNNAIARVAGLLAIAAVGAIAGSAFISSVDDAGLPRAERERAVARPMVVSTDSRAAETATADAAVDGFRAGMGLSAALLVAGGLVSLVGIVNPPRRVPCRECPGGQLVGAPEPAAA